MSLRQWSSPATMWAWQRSLRRSRRCWTRCSGPARTIHESAVGEGDVCTGYGAGADHDGHSVKTRNSANSVQGGTMPRPLTDAERDAFLAEPHVAVLAIPR